MARWEKGSLFGKNKKYHSKIFNLEDVIRKKIE